MQSTDLLIGLRTMSRACRLHESADYRGKSAHPRRVFWLVVLPMLALASCSAAGTSQDIATGNHFALPRGEFEQAMGRLPGVPKADERAVRASVLDRLIGERLFANAAIAEGLDHEPKVVGDIEAARRAILAQAYAQRATSQMAAPSETDVRAFYDAHPEAFSQRYSVEFDELVFAGPAALGQKLAQQYDTTQNFAQVARDAAASGVKVNAQYVATTSERLPTVVAQHLSGVAPGSNIIFPVQEGIVFARIRSISPAPLAFEQAAPLIRDGLQVKSRNAFLGRDLTRLRANAAVRITDPSLAPSGQSPAKKPLAG